MNIIRKYLNLITGTVCSDIKVPGSYRYRRLEFADIESFPLRMWMVFVSLLAAGLVGGCILALVAILLLLFGSAPKLVFSLLAIIGICAAVAYLYEGSNDSNAS